MDTDLAVIGAGVIGLAVARENAINGRSVILLEKEARFGTEVSSRNTEVIHAGIYYSTDSLKALLCLKGRILLYEYCKRNNIRHKRAGKLFVAVDSGAVSRLEQTKKQAVMNGVDDLIELDQIAIKRIEPEIQAKAALFSPSSGILDSHGFMKSLLVSGESYGVTFAPHSPVIGAEPVSNGWKIRVGGREPASITCNAVVNAAGLYSTSLSKTIFPERNVPELYPVKGSYVRYSGASPVSHIIYPAVVPGVIEERVDATPDFSGSLRFGPNVEQPDGLEDFSLSPTLVESMISGIKRYLPDLDVSRLHPDCSGIRPKIYGQGKPVKDFCFDWSPDGRWLDLWGIESPGLTASLAIGEHVCRLIREKDAL